MSDLRPAEAADRFALHLARGIDRGLTSVADRNRVETGGPRREDQAAARAR